MPSVTIEYEDESERLLIEQAAAMIADLRRTAMDAPHGTALAACEDQAVREGRRLTLQVLEDALRHRVAAVDSPKNGRPARIPRGSGPASS
jgi:ribulose 1,5-bisphosphate synthetase/thiazole synthase